MYIVSTPTGCVTHDGYVQLGIHKHSVEEHLRLNPATNWLEVYWMPDVFTNRYPRVTFQKTVACNEGSPKTDNSAQPRPRDFPST